jgi:hypothetical protein
MRSGTVPPNETFFAPITSSLIVGAGQETWPAWHLSHPSYPFRIPRSGGYPLVGILDKGEGQREGARVAGWQRTCTTFGFHPRRLWPVRGLLLLVAVGV